MSSIPFEDLSTNIDCTYFGKIGLSFWMTTVCSTAIHEFGHFLALYKYGVPVSEFCVGSEGKYTWQRHVRYNSCSTKIVLNFFRPLQGHVDADVRNLCVWKKINTAVAGPLLQLSTMEMVFCLTNRHLQDSKKNGTPYDPVIFGSCLASGVGISVACLNFLPLVRYSDGHRIFLDLWTIAKRSSL